MLLKLKPSECSSDRSSSNPDQLDVFVDEIIIDLQNTLLSNTNHLRKRIKQVRPDPNDPYYENKMIAYQQLLEQMISIIQQLQHVIGRTLNELHILVGQLWEDISRNNGNNIEQLLDEHEQRTSAFINQQWTQHINELEFKVYTLAL